MFFHWPDHNIGKRESRRIREEHNATVNKLLAERDELLNACQAMLDAYAPQRSLVERDKWNSSVEKAHSAIEKATARHESA